MIQENLSDNELIKKISEDSNFFWYIVDRYENKLMRYIMRTTDLCYEDAENILQEVFIKVYKNLNEFDNSFPFSSWIYRITHNYIIDYFRKTSKIEKLQLDDESYSLIIENIRSDKEPTSELDNKELKNILNKALFNIKREYREVFILKFLDEKSYEEISDILKIPNWTVGTLINRAKSQLREELDKLNFNK